MAGLGIKIGPCSAFNVTKNLPDRRHRQRTDSGNGVWGWRIHPLEQWDQQGGEVRWERAERDKSPGIKPGRKFSGGTRSGGSEGREENLPILPFHSEPSKAEIRAKSFHGQTQGSSDLKCARTPCGAPGSGNK